MAKATGHGSSFAAAFRDALSQVARPPRLSYTAKSGPAQFKQLARTARGRAALEEAGLTAARQTQRRWIGGKQKPSKANAAKISAAYLVIQRGQIPRPVKRGEMLINGRVGTGSDVRNRGSSGNAPLKVSLGNGNWDRIEAAWRSGAIRPGADDEEDGGELDDADLEDLISEDLIEEDIGGSDNWYFPGGGYTVTITY